MRRCLALLVSCGALATAVVARAETPTPAAARDTPTTTAVAHWTASSAAAPGPVFEPGLDVIGGYAFRLTETSSGETWYHEVRLDRAHLWLGARMSTASARVLIEAARSASGGGLIGVDGDSLVARFREAWLGWDPWGFLEVRAGLVRSLTEPALEHAFGLRALGPESLRRYGLLSPADLGATVRLRLPGPGGTAAVRHDPLDVDQRDGAGDGFGWIGFGVYNGEGYAQRELDRGKNTELAALVRPFAWLSPLAPIEVLASFTLGSSGTGSALANRAAGEVAWDTARLGAGVIFAWAFGLDDVPERDGWTLDGFVRAEPVHDLLLSLRASRFARDTADANDTLTTLSAAVGWRIASPLEAFLSLDRTIPGTTTKTALPDSDTWEIRAIGRMRL